MWKEKLKAEGIEQMEYIVRIEDGEGLKISRKECFSIVKRNDNTNANNDLLIDQSINSAEPPLLSKYTQNAYFLFVLFSMSIS